MKNILLDILLVFFSYFVPKKKNLYIFGAGDGLSYKGNPKYAYIHSLREHHDIIPLWITGSRKLKDKLTADGLPALFKYSFKAFAAILQGEYLIIEIMPKDIIYAGFHGLGRFRYIQTFHGMPLKKIGDDANSDRKGIADINTGKLKFLKKPLISLRNFLKRRLLYRRYSLIVSSGKECSKCFRTAFDNDKIILSGSPRNDILFDPDLRSEDLLKSIIKVKYKKIYSYIPTFRDNSRAMPFTEKGLLEIEKFLEKNNAVLCVKKHPYDRSLKIDGSFQRIIDVSSHVEDVMDMLPETDLLITDYSSVFFDFSLTRRPIIFYCYDLNEYLNTCRGMYFNYLTDLPGPFACNEKALLVLLKNHGRWFSEKKYSRQYNEFVDRFNSFSDKRSSERLINFLKEGRI